MFKKNLNTSGRLLRLAIAILLLAFALWQSSLLLLLASAFVFFEAFKGWCIVYQFLGKSSCPINTEEKK